MNIQRRYNIGNDFQEIIVPNPGHIVATTACLGGAPGASLGENMK